MSTEKENQKEENTNPQSPSTTNTEATLTKSPSGELNQNGEPKKSYKGVLTNKPDANAIASDSTSQTTTSTTTSTTPATVNTPAESNAQESESDKNSQDPSKRNTNNFQQRKNYTKPQQAWKKSFNSNQPGQRKKKDTESLSDLQSWPTLEQTKLSPELSQKKPKDATAPVEANVSTESQPQPTEEQQNSNSTEPGDLGLKKKGVNWVPFKDISAQPANSHHRGSHYSRGRGRGPRRDNHNAQNQSTTSKDAQNATSNSTHTGNPTSTSPTNQMGRGNWRGQSNPSYRGGSRRGGRGGNSGGYQSRGNVPQGAYMPPVAYYMAPLEGDALKEAIIKQLEYYFSVENLCKDIFLRQQMDTEGWIPISVIANFNRVKVLTTDIKLISETLSAQSTLIEAKDDKIRRKDDWKTWVLPPKVNQ